jgi:spore coat polysaccharide biosynthesis protein SpsF
MGGKELEHSDKIVCIIEARMSSSRLPGKVMEKIGNRNSLEHIVHRIRNVEAIDNICIATRSSQGLWE